MQGKYAKHEKEKKIKKKSTITLKFWHGEFIECPSM